MNDLPEKVQNALDTIDVTAKALLTSIEYDNIDSYSAFMVFNTLFTYQGALSRALDRNTYLLLITVVRTALQSYARRCGDVGMTNEKMHAIAKSDITTARNLIAKILT